ncbi:hypothetical protein [Planococcus donghaensis]|uniref:Uncharacterized protein n=1 Tax=Planococcus donghaensis TaxID=414778 RepID=A0A1C7EIF1_9BACL|nr:hypothetical protein [Planococcus donghaensis]ANU23754.1 hypothetical protein BCM40_10320 [Planococcus donghaensis]
MERSHAKKRKFISIDLTKGRSKFDTSKMNEWSPEEWAAFVGTEEDHHLEIPLLNTEKYRFLIVSISINEVTKAFTLEIQMENKTEKDIRIEVATLKIDEALFDVSKTEPFFIKAHAQKEGQITVIISGDYLEFFKNSISLSFDIKEVETDNWLEGYEVVVQVY